MPTVNGVRMDGKYLSPDKLRVFHWEARAGNAGETGRTEEILYAGAPPKPSRTAFH